MLRVAPDAILRLSIVHEGVFRRNRHGSTMKWSFQARRELLRRSMPGTVSGVLQAAFAVDYFKYWA